MAPARSEDAAPIGRRKFARVFAALGIAAPIAVEADAQAAKDISPEEVRVVSSIAGERISSDRLDSVRQAFQAKLQEFRKVRELDIAEGIEPAQVFVVHPYQTPGEP